MGHDVFVAGYAFFGGTTTYLLDFTAPWIAANHLSLELDDFEFTPRIGTYLGDTGRASAMLSCIQIASDWPGSTLSPSNRDRLFRLRASVGYDSRESWGDPGRSWLNELELIRTEAPCLARGIS